MSPTPSSPAPKTAAIAGALAGLLAAGLLGYYLYLQREPASAPPAAPPPVVAARAEASAPPMLLAQAEPSVAAPAPGTTTRSREQATAALMELPEIKAWSARLEKSSGGKVHGALIEDDPAPRTVHGKVYYQFSFVADGAEAAHHLESFLAARDGDEILVEDEDNEELMSLARWRQEKHPLQRDVATQ